MLPQINILLSLLIGYATCRGGQKVSLEEGDVYLPYPRIPVNKSNSYITKAPKEPITVEVYEGIEGYYMTYYELYPDWAKVARNISKDISNEEPVCINQHAVDDSGLYPGIFSCPVSFVPPEFTACCGSPYAEFCCLTKKALDKQKEDSKNGIIAFIFLIVGVMVGGFLFFILMRYDISNKCCKRKLDEDDE